MESYVVLEALGTGSFGKVYKGRRRGTGQFVALKFVPKVGRSDSDVEAVRTESAILRKLDHPNLLRLVDAIETETHFVLVTELAHGDLYEVLVNDGTVPEGVVRSVATQLVAGLHALHAARIVHRDVKPQNVFIAGDGVVKLGDMGFAREMSASTVMLSSLKGTPLYMPPETMLDHRYDYKADLWGLGVLLYELAVGRPPCYAASLHELLRVILTHDIEAPPTLSPPLRDLLHRLLQRDPIARIGWPDLLHHPFLAGGEVGAAISTTQELVASTSRLVSADDGVDAAAEGGGAGAVG